VVQSLFCIGCMTIADEFSQSNVSNRCKHVHPLGSSYQHGTSVRGISCVAIHDWTTENTTILAAGTNDRKFHLLRQRRRQRPCLPVYGKTITKSKATAAPAAPSRSQCTNPPIRHVSGPSMYVCSRPENANDF
jgi:hypothetical protein